jgi:hypothetical protein
MVTELQVGDIVWLPFNRRAELLPQLRIYLAGDGVVPEQYLYATSLGEAVQLVKQAHPTAAIESWFEPVSGLPHFYERPRPRLITWFAGNNGGGCGTIEWFVDPL